MGQGSEILYVQCYFCCPCCTVLYPVCVEFVHPPHVCLGLLQFTTSATLSYCVSHETLGERKKWNVCLCPCEQQ